MANGEQEQFTDAQLSDGTTLRFKGALTPEQVRAKVTEYRAGRPDTSAPPDNVGFVGGVGEGLFGTPHPLKALGSGLLTLVRASMSPQAPENENVRGAFRAFGRGIKGEAKRGFGIATGDRALILESLIEEGRAPTTGTEVIARTIPLGLGQPIETLAGGEISRGLGQATGSLLGLLAPTKGAQRSLTIAGKKFPATLGMLKPGTKLARLESLIEDIPILGGPIKAVKTEKVPLAARGAISDIASREAGITGRGATGFVEDVKSAGAEFHRNARTLYQGIEKDLANLSNINAEPIVGDVVRVNSSPRYTGFDPTKPVSLAKVINKQGGDFYIQLLGDAEKGETVGRAVVLRHELEPIKSPPNLDKDFIELQSQRQELQRARRRPSTSKEWIEINKDLAAVEDDLDALFEKAGQPKLTKSFEEANSLTGRAHAVEEFHKALSTSTKGLPEAKTPPGTAPRPQEINSQMLLSRVRKMSELPGKGGVSRLEQAFGKTGAGEILDVAEILDRARLDKSLGARLRQIGTGTTFVGLGGYGIYLSPAATAVAAPALATGAYITARAMANPGGRSLIRSFFGATPNSRRAAWLAGRLAEIAKNPENDESAALTPDIPPL